MLRPAWRSSRALQRGFAQKAKQQQQQQRKGARGKQQKRAPYQEPQPPPVALTKEQEGVVALMKRFWKTYTHPPKPERTAEELAAMQALMKDYSRRTLREHRMHMKKFNDILRLRQAALKVLPEPLLREAYKPLSELTLDDVAFPVDLPMPTDTPPIANFQEKVAAAEAAILEEDALLQREADAKAKRLEREERARQRAHDAGQQGGEAHSSDAKPGSEQGESGRGRRRAKGPRRDESEEDGGGSGTPAS